MECHLPVYLEPLPHLLRKILKPIIPKKKKPCFETPTPFQRKNNSYTTPLRLFLMEKPYGNIFQFHTILVFEKNIMRPARESLGWTTAGRRYRPRGSCGSASIFCHGRPCGRLCLVPTDKHCPNLQSKYDLLSHSWKMYVQVLSFWICMSMCNTCI